MSTKNINAWDWDVRVRERNLHRGVLTDKDVEKMLGGLSDLAASADNLTLPQPALSASGAADDEADEGDDEEEAES